MIEKGGAFLHLERRKEALALSSGDLVVLPHGRGHELSDSRGRRPVPLARLLGGGRSGRCKVLRHGGGGPETLMICGSFRFRERRGHPLLSLLPEVIHLPGEAERTPEWLDATLRFLASAARSARPGRDAVVGRLTDVVVQVVRAWIEKEPAFPLSGRSGMACTLAAMRHEALRAGGRRVQTTIGALLASALLPAMGWPAAGAETRADPQPQTSTPQGECAIPEPPDEPGLLRQIGGDFRRFTSRDTVIALGLGGGLSLAALPHDRRLTEAASRSAKLDGFFRFGAVSGGGWVEGGGAVATYALGRLAQQRGVTSLGRDLVRAQLLNAVVTSTLKVALRRERPDGSSRLSFPSGHSSATFATATVVERHLGWKAGLPAYAFAVYVAGSRLQDNKHLASDVVVGAALGIAAGRAVAFGRDRTRVSVTPALFPAGPGLAVALHRGRRTRR